HLIGKFEGAKWESQREAKPLQELQGLAWVY
ncbi:unnamed protein product, partial [marine sediment metagenome]